VTTLLRERDGSIQVLMPCPPDVDANDPDASLEWVERLRCSLEESLAPKRLQWWPGSVAPPARNDGVRSDARGHARGRHRGQHCRRLAGGTALRPTWRAAPDLSSRRQPGAARVPTRCLGPLETSDTARRSEFVRTLEAFLRAEAITCAQRAT